MPSDHSISWIKNVDYDEADVELKKVYDSVRSPSGTLDNLYRAFSLRPHTIEPADDLYLTALHHDDNTLPKWFSELIGSYVAVLTGCEYALTHHSHNFIRLFNNQEKAESILQALQTGRYDEYFDEKRLSALRYAEKLTLKPNEITAFNIDALRETGWSDGEILEIAQIVAMFSYFVRIINGVGISLTEIKSAYTDNSRLTLARPNCRERRMNHRVAGI